jgi:hypothetical protein
MALMEELKAARKCVALKITILEATRGNEHISRCKPADPKKFQERRWVRINTWLDAMEFVSLRVEDSSIGPLTPKGP